jgi:carbon-monoxide dehydrogenase medium subunit
MRPADFDYIRAGDLGHALDLLAAAGDDAKVMAGGQSLVPMLMTRLAQPRLVIDIGRLSELRQVVVEAGIVRIGATVTHADLEYGPAGAAARRAIPALESTARLIGHHPIRTRGTFGGSIAHADPAAEWCLLAHLLDARVVVRSRGASREITAAQFFQGFFTTDLRDDEIVTEVRLPTTPHAVTVIEIARRHGDFPIVSAGAAMTVDGGVCTDVRVGLGGVSDVPVRLRSVERDLVGRPPHPDLIARAAAVAGDLIHPASDTHGTADYRRRLAAVLTRRALVEVARAAARGVSP